MIHILSQMMPQEMLLGGISPITSYSGAILVYFTHTDTSKTITLERSPDNSSWTAQSVGAGAGSAYITGLTPNTYYYVRAKYVGTSSYTATSYVRAGT